KFISTNFQRSEGGSLDIRANILKNVQYYFAESMGFGVGAGNADYFLKNEPIFPIGVFSNVHNWWGEILVNYGAIVFGGYLAMYLS
ncbi:O-antigen ligase family protein, partial [Micrococcus sp. SIMBA_131]